MTSMIRLAVVGSWRRWSVLVLAAVITAALVIFGGVTRAPVASAAPAAPTIIQCNPAESFPGSTAGWEVTCNVTIENTITSTGATSSMVTATACLTAAGVIPTPADCEESPGYYNTVTTSVQLVTSVNQCNGTATGGGSNVICNVTVINNIPITTPTSGVTVNQCIGSGTGGGGTVSCVPLGSTTSATVTQCNGSATGGGTYAGETTVNCTVTGAVTALPVTINQCNGTATGGGSAVTCATTITNNFATTPPTTTTTTTTPPPTTTTTTPPPTTTTTTPPPTTTTTTPGSTTTTPGSTTTTPGSTTTTPGAATTTPGAARTTSSALPFTGFNSRLPLVGGLVVALGVFLLGLSSVRRRRSRLDRP
jgi:hypothetical protein